MELEFKSTSAWHQSAHDHFLWIPSLSQSVHLNPKLKSRCIWFFSILQIRHEQGH